MDYLRGGSAAAGEFRRQLRVIGRFDETMRVHLQKSTIVLTLLADEDRVDRRLHVVADAARARAFEEGKGAIMRSDTISWLSRGSTRAKNTRLWQKRTRAILIVIVTQSITTISWLQTNC